MGRDVRALGAPGLLVAAESRTEPVPRVVGRVADPIASEGVRDVLPAGFADPYGGWC